MRDTSGNIVYIEHPLLLHNTLCLAGNAGHHAVGAIETGEVARPQNLFNMHEVLAITIWILLTAVQGQYLAALPDEFANGPASWALISYTSPSVAVISGSFNRTIAQAPWVAQTSDVAVQQA